METVAKGRIKHLNLISGQGLSQPLATHGKPLPEGELVPQQAISIITSPMSSDEIQQDGNTTHVLRIKWQ